MDTTELAAVIAKHAEGPLDQNGFGGAKYPLDAERVHELSEWLRKRATAVPIDEDSDPDALWWSYGLKHRVEDIRDEYVANGEIIAAALVAGFPVVRASTLSPNAYIGIKSDGLFGDEVAA